MKEENVFEEFDAVSATDCTGLISSAPQNEYEYNSYFDVMTFSPTDFHTAENSEKNPLAQTLQ